MLIDEYVDDGISGTQFDRDGFEKHCTNYINYFFFHDIPPRYKQKLDTFVPSFLLITNTLVRLNSNGRGGENRTPNSGFGDRYYTI